MNKALRGSKKCVLFFPLTNTNTQRYGTTWRIATLWEHTTTQEPQLPHMTCYVATRNQRHNAKNTCHHQQLRLSKVVVQIKTRQYQGTMGYHFQKSQYIAVRKQNIVQKIHNHQNPTLVLDHNHYRWYLSWTKPQGMYQQQKLSTQIGSFWTHDQPSAPSEKILSKTSNPMMQ